MIPELRVIGITGMAEIRQGDDLPTLIAEAAGRQDTPIQPGDIVVVTQKIVSKAEGRVVRLDTVTPSPFAVAIAQQWNKDPRHVEVVLRESTRIVRMDRGVIISQTRHGLICANAGVDASNMPEGGTVALLPEDPDASAQRIRLGLMQRVSGPVAVMITDTFGRPWREGTTNVAIGVAGINPLKDYRGQHDPYGYLLQVSVAAIADEVAGAADLVMNKTIKVPVALVRGPAYESTDDTARHLIRNPELDLFR